jgi:Fe2+ transport system protein FeoA
MQLIGKRVQKKYKLVRILNEDVSSRLNAMGIIPGSEVEIVRRTLLGSAVYVVVNHRAFGITKSVMNFLELQPS